MPEFKPFDVVIREFMSAHNGRTGSQKLLENATLVKVMEDTQRIQQIANELKKLGHTGFEYIGNGASAVAFRSSDGQVIRIDVPRDNATGRDPNKFMLQANQSFSQTVNTTYGPRTLNVEVAPFAETLHSQLQRGAITREQAVGIANRFIVDMARQGAVSTDLIQVGGGVRLDNIGLKADGTPIVIDPGSKIHPYKPGTNEMMDSILDLESRKKSIPDDVAKQKWSWDTKTNDEHLRQRTTSRDTTVGDARLNTTTRGVGLGLGVFGTASDGVGLVKSLMKGDWSGAGQAVTGLISSAGMVVNDALSMLGKAASLTLGKVAAVTAVTTATKATIAYTSGDTEGAKTQVASGTGALVGSVAGSATGAAIGAWVGGFLGTAIPIPVVGTVSGIALGTAVGGFLGGFFGGWGGSTIAEGAVKTEPHKQAALPSAPEKTVTAPQPLETKPSNYAAYAPSEDAKTAPETTKTAAVEPEKKAAPVVMAAATQTKTTPKTAAPAVA